MNRVDYAHHLHQVSRSFAFCIEKLHSPFREWVALSYLLCRVLDTVEDALWADPRQQQRQFSDFDRFLAAPTDATRILRWAEEFPSSIRDEEKELLADAPAIFAAFHELPADAREAILPYVRRMSQGMAHFTGTRTRGPLKLSGLTEVNQYCFFVAGVIGELLTRLFAIYRPSFRPTEEIYRDSYRFGLFLQKINLLKDQRTDESEGRFLVPSRPAMLASLRKEGEGAIRYLLSLPKDEPSYRIFCGWSLFLGLASLPFINQAASTGETVKISRSLTAELLRHVESLIADDDALREMFDEQIATLPEAPLSGSTSPVIGLIDPTWFESVASGTLTRADLVGMQML